MTHTVLTNWEVAFLKEWKKIFYFVYEIFFCLKESGRHGDIALVLKQQIGK